MRKVHVLFHAMIMFLIVSFSSCAPDEVRKVELDNSFAVSLFSDTIKLEQFLNSMDSVASEWINVDEEGYLYAYYADSIKGAVTGNDLLGEIEDLRFDVASDFELPEIPGSPEPIPLEWTFDDLAAVPFVIEGYAINSVLLRSGRLAFSLNTNLPIIDYIELKTDNIKLLDGSSLSIKLDIKNKETNVDINLEKCRILPENGEIKFSAALGATVSDKPIGGDYSVALKGGITNLKFESIDGAIDGLRFDFYSFNDINFGMISNIIGDFTITTPIINVRYLNSFGFKADATLDSLYLTTADNTDISLIKDWKPMEMILQPTHGNYESIANFSEQVVDELNILEKYTKFLLRGDIVMSCEDVEEDMISYSSNIDIVADVKMPMNFKMYDLRYVDTIDVNISMTEIENEAENETEPGTDMVIFDELELKLIVENKLPIQITPLIYMVDDGVIIDSLFTGNSCIQGCFDGTPTKNALIVKIVDEKIDNILSSDQLILDLRFSTEGNMSMMNINDYVKLRLGLKTKTTQISF